MEQTLKEAGSRLRNYERANRDLAEELERQQVRLLNSEQQHSEKIASIEQMHQKRLAEFETARGKAEAALRKKLEDQLALSQQTKEQLQADLDRANQGHHKALFEQQEQLHALAATKSELTSQVALLRTEIGDYQRNLARTESENERLKSEVKRLQDTCDKVSLDLAESASDRDRLERGERAWQKTKRDLEEVISKLKENLEKRDEQVEQLTGEVQEAERRIDEAAAVLLGNNTANRSPSRRLHLAQ